ncbi:ATPase [Methanocalculus alkaliphilus]|uniref:PINc/VapC family ATPase n=1 Tax=Methanocalculus alkaliphilus TaxID=768730 RepID=UPI0020A13DD7|nr:PINc/VapC family ATPase [Methanocalculus alkaliphilus]MCP1714807.1 ATPase [Methanocalculus alkaliphilus]
MKLVPDTSVVIDGRITTMIHNGDCKNPTIIIPEAVFAELEAQANHGREIGFSGLTEIQELCRMRDEGLLELKFVGERPRLDQVKLSSGGEIDAMIRNAAIEYDATFVTSDVVQAEVARARGLEVIYLKPQQENFTPLLIDNFFDENTIAVYLKDRVSPYARKGRLKEMRLVPIREAPMTEYELRRLAQEILERAKRDPDGFIEIEKRGVTVVQIGSLRISITRRPFSDGMEISAVRPIAHISLDDYDRAEEIKEGIVSDRCGTLIVGPPGSGKSTLAQSIAIFLADRDFVVKTMEAPRDLQVPDHITQYTSLEGSMEATAELLMLVRPDFVIFDEIRKKDDFAIYADLQLSGIGMVGVMHAQRVQDAIQRLIGRIDYCLLPQVISSIIFVSDGEIEQVFTIDFSIDRPTGLADLGVEIPPSPVVTISNSADGTPVVEIFRFGGETIVVSAGPADSPENALEEPENDTLSSEPEVSAPQPQTPPHWKVIEKEIQKEIGRFTEGFVDVRMISDTKATVFIDDQDIPAAIGKGGKNISGIVNKVGVGIDIRSRSELSDTDDDAVEEMPLKAVSSEQSIQIRTDKKQLALICPEHSGKIVDVFSGKEYLFTGTVEESGEILLARNNSIAQEMIRRFEAGEDIRVRPVD